jgi:hypothetical protein
MTKKPSDWRMATPALELNLCTRDKPMKKGAQGQWQHPDAKLDYQEWNDVSARVVYAHYTCPNCGGHLVVEVKG